MSEWNEKSPQPKPGVQTSEYKLTKVVILIGMLCTVIGPIMCAEGPERLHFVGQILTAVGPAVSAWAVGAYAKARGKAKS